MTDKKESKKKTKNISIGHMTGGTISGDAIIAGTINQVHTGTGDNIGISQSMFTDMKVNGDLHIGDVVQSSNVNQVHTGTGDNISVSKITSSGNSTAAGKITAKNSRIGGRNINITSGTINSTAAGAFNQGDITGVVANNIQISNQNVDLTTVKSNDDSKSQSSTPTKEYLTEFKKLLRQCTTLADIIYTHGKNIPDNTNPLDLIILVDEIVNKIKKEVDIYQMCLENNKFTLRRAILNKLQDNKYSDLVLAVLEQIKEDEV